MITAETAVVLPVLVALLALLLGVLGHGLDQAKAVDAARNGARAAARGESPSAIKQAVIAEAPPGSQVQIDVSGSRVTVDVAATGSFTVRPDIAARSARGVGRAIGRAATRVSRHSDEGSATVWTMSFAALLTAVGVTAILIVAGLTAHRQASAAADLAALAAASRSLSDESTGM